MKYSLDALRMPFKRPATTFAIPQLWERAKAMFAVMLAQVKSASDLSRWARLHRAPRHEILSRLVPVEKLVRGLLIVEALTFLLMTPQGLKLLRETPRIEPPKPPPPVGERKHSTRIPMPGWHTIAALRPRIDPRVKAPEPEPVDRHDPDTWSCRFRVLRWTHPRPGEPDAPASRQKPAPSLIMSLDDDPHWPTVHGPSLREPEKPDLDNCSDPAAASLARRIAALERIIADPQPAIRRLAKFIASLPRGMLAEPDPGQVLSLWWWHGRPEFLNVCELEARAVIAFNRREDPG